MADWDSMIRMAWLVVGAMIAVGFVVGVVVGWLLRGKARASDSGLREAADEAARIIFHGMHPAGVGRKDEPPECHGFKQEMARIIMREVGGRR